MIHREKITLTIMVTFMLCFSVTSLGQNCFDYKNTTDKLEAKVIFDNKLHSGFFNSHETVYPAPVSNCKWNILSKKLIFKNNNIKKGKRIYAWVSVEFEEISTYQGETTTNQYKIEGYLKPVVH